MATNRSTERSYSYLKSVKDSYRTAMQQGRLDGLFLLSMEADVLQEISLDDLIYGFSIKKSVRKVFNQ